MKKTYISFYSASRVVLGQGGLKPSRTTCFLILNRKERKKKTKTTTMELQIPMPSWRLNYGIWTITRRKIHFALPFLKKKQQQQQYKYQFALFEIWFHLRAFKLLNGEKWVKLCHYEPLVKNNVDELKVKMDSFLLVLFLFFRLADICPLTSYNRTTLCVSNILLDMACLFPQVNPSRLTKFCHQYRLKVKSIVAVWYWYCQEFIQLLYLNINVHILHTVFYTFLKVLTRRI